jgi:glycosyltransferase involved in cell wall biosynthesis
VSVVGVVIPVRDGERHLAAALGSVVAQTQSPADVVVVDDGSQDGTGAVAARFAPLVRCVRQEPAGTSTAVNRGVGVARGELLAFIDADDLWTPDKLHLQAAALKRDLSLDLVLGHVRHFHSPELTEHQRARIVCPPERMPGYCCGAMLIRREALERVGPFDSEWRLGGFIDWWARAVDAGLRCLMLPRVVMHRRVHAANDSLVHRDDRQEYARVLRAALARRRGEPAKERR